METAFDSPLDAAALVHPTAVAFGGGLNSTALLVEWVLLEYPRIGRILFADTGGERKQTYEHVERFSRWLESNGQPAIEVIKKGGRRETLEENCLRQEMLPSLAYGRKGCSHKFKIEPQAREINRWLEAKHAWEKGDKVLKLIGYGYEEQRRISLAKLEDEKYYYRFPLNEWRMDRAACEATIKRAGLELPGKSACFFCPASTKNEITALAEEDPSLLKRALHIEDVARASGKLQSSKGLGRRFAWRDFLEGQVTEDNTSSACLYCVDE